MIHANLRDMVKGWFVGGFTPNAFFTDACEVAVKQYKAGDYEASHFHKIATEVTLILSGRVRMAGSEWTAGDIIVLSPGEVTDFEALEDAVNVVVKVPGISDDKYIVKEQE
jgi:quercetin dioxygenase-like cupin family protein